MNELNHIDIEGKISTLIKSKTRKTYLDAE